MGVNVLPQVQKTAVDIANNADKEIPVRHLTAARRAFTMIELLVVITIIVMLVGLGILAYSHIDRAMVQRSTRADLQMAQGFLDEYNAGPGLSQLGMGNNQLDRSFPYKGGVFPAANPPVSGPNNAGPIGGTSTGPSPDPQTNVSTGDVSLSGDQRMPTPNTPPVYNPPGTVSTPMTVSWDFGYDPMNSNSHNAVYNTGQVMVFLMRLPAVTQAISKLSSTKLLTIQGKGSNAQLTYAVTTGNLPGPVLLDGWGNPIIFVPAGGLVTKVSGGANGTQHVLVRSSGLIVLDGSPYSGKNPPPLKDNDHPFWASAGPDGDFYGGSSTNGGDDNVYSFQQ